MKVALVYDRINKWGGAEQVLLALHRIFPGAPLFTSVYSSSRASWARDFDIKTSFLQDFPNARTSHELYATLMPIVFESFSFDKFDVVISVTSEAAKGIITKPSTMHICLCLTPTRYLWSGYHDYFSDTLMRAISRPVVSYLRIWDGIACTRPDYYVAISNEVQDRIKRYYDRDSDVIYPAPIGSGLDDRFRAETRYNRDSGKPGPGKTRGDYFLVVSRLVSYKRIDIAIQAANKLKIPLKVIGIGSQLDKLKRIAGDSIEFLGFVDDGKLQRYLKSAKALIFPGSEDFGLSIVEAQAIGVPVIAYRKGGALEIIQEGTTGEFFNEQTADSLTFVLKTFDQSRYNSQKCVENAKRFSCERFEKEFRKYFEEKTKEYFGKKFYG